MNKLLLLAIGFLIFFQIFVGKLVFADPLDEVLPPNSSTKKMLKTITADGDKPLDLLISYKRTAIKRYPKAYQLIFRDGLREKNEYNRQTIALLIETFDLYLMSEPNIDSVAKFLISDDRIPYEDLITLKRKALSLCKIPTDFNKILDGLNHDDGEYRRNTFQLLLDHWESYLATRPTIEQLLDIARYNNTYQILFNGLTKEYVWNKFLDLLALNPPLAIILKFMAPNGYYAYSFVVKMKEAAMQHYTSLNDHERILADCVVSAHIQYREACSDLVYQDAESRLKTPLKTDEAKMMLNRLSLFGFKQTRLQDEYEILLSRLIRIKLEEDFRKYQERTAQPASNSTMPLVFSAQIESDECPVCLKKYDAQSKHIIKNCGHSMCKECLAEYLTDKMNKGDPLICASPGCKMRFSKEDGEVLSALKKEQFFMIQLREQIMKIPGSTPCSQGTCKSIFVPKPKKGFKKAQQFFKRTITKQEANFHKVCEACKINQCLKCGLTHVRWACDEYKNSSKLSDAMFRQQILSGNYKPCPHCYFLIYKTSGCNNMFCTKCLKNFDWGYAYNPDIYGKIRTALF